jgi:hypothetical protein
MQPGHLPMLCSLKALHSSTALPNYKPLHSSMALPNPLSASIQNKYNRRSKIYVQTLPTREPHYMYSKNCENVVKIYPSSFFETKHKSLDLLDS